MKLSHLLFVVISPALIAAAVSCKTGHTSDDNYIVAAYIWPSCHDNSLAHVFSEIINIINTF